MFTAFLFENFLEGIRYSK